jgi:hypothetical protein
MIFSEEDLKFFINNIWDDSFQNNNGGMASPDMFTLFFTLKQINPKVVIESGVWNGLSTKLIRKTLGLDAIIICLDPREIPPGGYKDNNQNTIYYIGKKFVDFNKLDLKKYNSNDIFAFFDCHQNAPLRLLQCKNKNIIHCLFNDNYPTKLGSHYTFEHLFNNDNRLNIFNNNTKKQIIDLIEIYHIYPNIFSTNITVTEGNIPCKGFFENDPGDKIYNIFKNDINKYRWNTYIKIKN